MPIILESAALPALTAYDIIKRAYQILGDVGTGEELTAAQKETGLEGLNAMLELFSIERLMIYEIRQESFTWPASTASQTIGSGGDIDTHRPDRVENGCYFMDSNNIGYPVEVTRNRATYDQIVDKTIESAYPELLFYDPSVSLATLYVYPIPNQSLTFFLNQWQPLQTFDTLTEEHYMPPGYRQMMSYNLAEHLEGEVGLPLSVSARAIASRSKSAIKRHNNIPVYAATDVSAALHGRGKSDIVAGK